MAKRRYSGSYGYSKRRRIGPRSGVLGNLALGAARLASMYYGRASSSKVTSGQGVTSQYDKKTVYRKKRMPYRKKKRWIGFSKKVNAVLEKAVGTKTIVRNAQLSSTDLTAGQTWMYCHLYGRDGSTTTSVECGQDDIAKITDNDATLDQTSRINFGSGVLDLTMTNLSTITDDSNQNSSLEVDIYEIGYGSREADVATLTGLFANSASITTPVNAAVPSITSVDRGVTPFDFPEALSRCKVKILKKTKYFLSYGQCATYQVRIAKNYTWPVSYIQSGDNNMIVPYVTRSLIIVTKGVPTVDATKVLKNLQVGVTRKYTYKIYEQVKKQDNIIA